MLDELKLKKCVINDGEFEFLYSRFGEQFNLGNDYGANLNEKQIILIIDIDLTDDIEAANSFITNMSILKDLDVKSFDFYDLTGEKVIARLTDYGKMTDLFTDLVMYGNDAHYRGTIRYGKNFLND